MNLQPHLEIPVRIGRQNSFLGFALCLSLGNGPISNFFVGFFFVGWIMGLIVTIRYDNLHR